MRFKNYRSRLAERGMARFEILGRVAGKAPRKGGDPRGAAPLVGADVIPPRA